jgi:hypothetical protein
LLVRQISAIRSPSQKFDLARRAKQLGRGGFFVLGMTSLITKKTELRLLARTHTRTMVAVLVGIARSNAAPLGARIAAAIAVLDRGWGRPTTMLAAEDGNPVVFRITEIVNDIVDPTPLGEIPVISEAHITPQLEALDARSELSEAEREGD